MQPVSLTFCLTLLDHLPPSSTVQEGDFACLSVTLMDVKALWAIPTRLAPSFPCSSSKEDNARCSQRRYPYVSLPVDPHGPQTSHYHARARFDPHYTPNARDLRKSARGKLSKRENLPISTISLVSCCKIHGILRSIGPTYMTWSSHQTRGGVEHGLLVYICHDAFAFA